MSYPTNESKRVEKSRTVMNEEVFVAFEVQCPECLEYVVLRRYLETQSISTPRIHFCSNCKHQFRRHFLLIERLRKKAAEVFVVDCDHCGSETVSINPPTICRHCQKPF